MNTPTPGASDSSEPFTATAFRHQLASLLELRAACPAYEIWWEARRPGPPAIIAKRRPGASCHPHTLVTQDIAEIRAALKPG
jgi:hypothetical protein